MSAQSPSEILIAYISEQILNGQDGNLQPEDDLLGSGMVDSMGMMRLIGYVEEEFGINVPPQDMVIENFMTVAAIESYVLGRHGSAQIKVNPEN